MPSFKQGHQETASWSTVDFHDGDYFYLHDDSTCPRERVLYIDSSGVAWPGVMTLEDVEMIEDLNRISRDINSISSSKEIVRRNEERIARNNEMIASNEEIIAWNNVVICFLAVMVALSLLASVLAVFSVVSAEISWLTNAESKSLKNGGG